MDIDAKAALFFSQLAIAGAVLGLCIVKLAMSDDCDTRNTYNSLLTFIVGIWLPTPMR